MNVFKKSKKKTRAKIQGLRYKGSGKKQLRAPDSRWHGFTRVEDGLGL
jgi:hypothetical protein